MSSLCLQTLLVLAASAPQGLEDLPVESTAAAPRQDWLIAPTPFRARIARSSDGKGIVLTNRLVRRELRLDPGATVALDDLTRGVSVLRGIKPEARLTLDGVEYDVGGLVGQPNYAFLRPDQVDQLQVDPSALGCTGFEIVPVETPLGWKRVRHNDEALPWPPAGVGLRMDYAPVEDTGSADVRVSVHYELFDGLPCFAKWIEVHNDGENSITVDRFTSEILAAVEPESRVETREEVPFRTPNLWVETDYATGGAYENGQRWSVHWVPDPDYASQVNYLRQTPCLLECRPSVGPAQDVAPGETFRSFKTWVLVHDSEEHRRNGLARCRMYRTIAPWVTENPLMMHVRHADRESVERAIDQCAEVGFEMVILTFGSGFDIENDSPEYLARMKGYAGDSCDECGNFTLVRNGTCLKCTTCGATSGCS